MTDLFVHEGAVMQDLFGSHVKVDEQIEGMCVVVIAFPVTQIEESCHQAATLFLLLLCKPCKLLY